MSHKKKRAKRLTLANALMGPIEVAVQMMIGEHCLRKFRQGYKIKWVKRAKGEREYV